MTIAAIDVWNFRPPFRDGPFAMSHVTSDHAFGRILCIHDDKGQCGIGEVVFSPSVDERDRESRIADEEKYLQPLIGQSFDSLLDTAADMRTREKSWRGIAFALETAWFDREGQRKGQSASQLLGGAQQSAISDYFSISESDINSIRKRVRTAGSQRRVFQLKLGVGSLERDAAQVAAILDMMTDNQIVQADANGGWTVEQACKIICQFSDHRLIWEEPCTTYADNVRVAQETGQHVMVDQCVSDVDAALHAIRHRAAHAICIKPAPLGGLIVARQVRDRAIEAEMLMRIDGPWCGDIATAAALHLAVGTPAPLLLAGCDLREPLAIPVELNGVCVLDQNLIAPPDGNGIGIKHIHEQLGPPEKTISI